MAPMTQRAQISSLSTYLTTMICTGWRIVQHIERQTCLDRDCRDRVRQHAVDLAGDAQPLLGHAASRLALAIRLGPAQPVLGLGT